MKTLFDWVSHFRLLKLVRDQIHALPDKPAQDVKGLRRILDDTKPAYDDIIMAWHYCDVIFGEPKEPIQRVNK